MRSFAQIQPVFASSADPRNVPDWNNHCLKFEQSNVFHTTEWARVLLDTYRWQPFYFCREDAILPIIEARSWLTGVKGIALPFSDFCQPLGSSAALKPLFDAAVFLGRSRGWKYLELRGGEASIGYHTFSAKFYTHELDLRPGPDEILKRCASSVRRAINKSHLHSVTVSIETDSASLDAFWQLHCQTRRKHGVPPQPYSFMKSIREELLNKGMGFIAVARQGVRPLAACLFLHFGPNAIYKFGASDETMQHLRANNAAFWGGIQECLRRSLSSLHFGRTDLHNEGLRRFKLGWGAKEQILSYGRFDLSLGRFVETGPDHENPWTHRLFRQMPAPLLRLVGALLYRHAA